MDIENLSYIRGLGVKYGPRGEVPAPGPYFTLVGRGAPEQRFPLLAGSYCSQSLIVYLRQVHSFMFMAPINLYIRFSRAVLE